MSFQDFRHRRNLGRFYHLRDPAQKSSQIIVFKMKKKISSLWQVWTPLPEAVKKWVQQNFNFCNILEWHFCTKSPSSCSLSKISPHGGVFRSNPYLILQYTTIFLDRPWKYSLSLVCKLLFKVDTKERSHLSHILVWEYGPQKSLVFPWG